MNENIKYNYPEMWGHTEDEIQVEFRALIGKYVIRCKKQLELPLKQGVMFDSIISEIGANNTPNRYAGWYKYFFTRKAFEKFSKENNLTLNMLLD